MALARPPSRIDQPVESGFAHLGLRRMSLRCTLKVTDGDIVLCLDVAPIPRRSGWSNNSNIKAAYKDGLHAGWFFAGNLRRLHSPGTVYPC